MKKLLTLVVAFLITLATYAQVGIGLTSAKIKSYVKQDETMKEKTLSDGSKVIVVSNQHYLRTYFFSGPLCDVYAVVPKDAEACETFEAVCNSRYTKIGKGKWQTTSNGKNIFVQMEYDDEIGEHVYLFVEVDGSDDVDS